jgi:hypothetical protein
VLASASLLLSLCSIIMASPSNFSFDNWDQLLEVIPTTSPSLGATQAPTPSSTSSGEFQPFLAVGVSVAGGIENCLLYCMEDA